MEDKSVPKNQIIKQKNNKNKIIDLIPGIFIIFILPYLLSFILYYFRSFYKNFPILYTIILIINIIYILLTYFYLFVLAPGF